MFYPPNLWDRPGAHLDYTAFDLPKKVAIPGDELSFDYDGHQQRIRKRSLTKETVYFDQLYERVSDSLTGEVEHRFYVYSDEKLVAIHSESNLGANDTRYVHTDHLGSTDVITDSQGQVIERQSFSVFGTRRNAQWGAGPLQSGPPETTRGFTGHEGDEELGLINMRGRMMDPHIGRFVTPDPLISNPQLAQGWNPFVYALNSPLSEVDPSGLSVVTAEPEVAKISAHCQCYEVTVHGAPRAGKEVLPRAVIPERSEDQVSPAPVDLGSAGLPSQTAAPDPTHTEIPDHYIENDFGHNASEAVKGTGEGVGTLLWEGGKTALLHAATLGLYSKWSTMYEVGQGAGRAWQSGDWAGFIDTSIGIFNRNYNPLHAAAEHGYYAYLSGKFNDWRAAFKHGTIATILTVLTIVTTAKGVKGVIQKGSPPNPHGSRGGPAHRSAINQRIEELKAAGHEHIGGGRLREEVIPTPGGIKSSRRPDITTRTPQNTIYRENVGHSTEAGRPIARENAALNDIEKATGSRPGFTPFDK